MKPYVILNSSITFHVPYNLKISTKVDVFDQKRGQIDVKPGYHLEIRVTPKVTATSDSFKTFDSQTRNCKFQFERKEMTFLQNYSKDGCEFECALKDALEICKCLPWYYPNDFQGIIDRLAEIIRLVWFGLVDAFHRRESGYP